MSQAPKSNDPRVPVDRLVMLVLLAALLFASPLFDWVLRERPSWYAPFVLWAILIAAIFALSRAINRP